MLLRPKWVDKSSLILFTKQFWFLFFNTAIYWISRKCLLFTWFFASDATVLSFLQENRHPLLAVCEAEPIGRGAAAVSPLLHPLSQLQSARCKSCSVLHIFYSYPPIASEVRFQDFPKPSTDFKHFEATANPLLASQKFVRYHRPIWTTFSSKYFLCWILFNIIAVSLVTTLLYFCKDQEHLLDTMNIHLVVSLRGIYWA